ncbi:unnamed protein product [Rhizophagus irregularis]|nr:unnamed protein product [Rhizophagus irregularis]
MRQCVPKFLLFKEMLCKSLSDLREYIMEAGLHTPPEKIKASLFVSIRPHQKRIITKKSIFCLIRVVSMRSKNIIVVIT